MNLNRTFTMLKPDSIEQGNMLPILNMIENAGFKIIALKYNILFFKCFLFLILIKLDTDLIIIYN